MYQYRSNAGGKMGAVPSIHKQIFSYVFLMFILVTGADSLFSQDKATCQLFFTSDVYGYLKPCG